MEDGRSRRANGGAIRLLKKGDRHRATATFFEDSACCSEPVPVFATRSIAAAEHTLALRATVATLQLRHVSRVAGSIRRRKNRQNRNIRYSSYITHAV